MAESPYAQRRARTGSQLVQELKLLVDESDMAETLEHEVAVSEQRRVEEEEASGEEGGVQVAAATLIGVSVTLQIAAKDIPTKSAPGATPSKSKNTEAAFADSLLSAIKQEMLTTEVQKTQAKAGGSDESAAPLAIVADEFDPWVSLVSRLAIECLPPFHAGRLPVFPINFTWLKMLQQLELVNHDFSSLPSAFANLQELRELTIANCRLKSANELSALSKIKRLNLCFNKLTSLSKTLTNCTGLESLNVSNNQLKEVPSDVKLLPRLQFLDVSCNRISKLPSDIKSCTALVHLNLEGNTLGAGVLNRSPLSAISCLQQLSVLNVSGNKLTSLPSVSNLTNLLELRMADNAISSLPSGLACLSLLQTLDVSNNQLSDLPPDGLLGLVSLTHLSFASNKCKFVPAALAASLSLTRLDGSSNRLSAVPDALGKLTSLKEMRLADNALVLVPKGVFGTMKSLEVLDLSENSLARLPDDFHELSALVRCELSGNKLQGITEDVHQLSNLTHLHLGSNLLRSVPPSIGKVAKLKCLELHNNPTLHTLPQEFLCLTTLQEISLSNFKIDANSQYCGPLEVSLKKSSSSKQVVLPDLTQLTSMVRNCPHPLLVYALAEFADKREHHPFLRLHIGDILYLVSLFPTSPGVSLDATRALVRLAHNPELRAQMVDTAGLQDTITELSMHEENPEIAVQALNVVANVCLDLGIKKRYLETVGVEQLLQRATSSPNMDVRAVCRKVLAVLGHTSISDMRLTHVPEQRGLRILAMDGGGTKSVSTIAILQALEARTGKKVYEMFDLICGTSVGGILACLLGVKCFDASHVEVLQKKFFKEVFSTKGGQSDSGLSQKFSLLSNMISTGGRYDTAHFETILKDVFTEEALIDSSGRTEVPKVFVASVLMDYFPPAPYLFRNYEYPPGRESRYEGTCERGVWEGIRATSAAPSMFSECIYDGRRFSDGGIAVNNPTGLAYHEALCIWGKERPIDCIVSIGTGAVDDKKQTKSLKDFVLSVIESATSVARIDDVMQDFFGDEVYFRFNVVDEAFDVILDETRDERLLAMTDASNRYVEKTKERIVACSKILGGPNCPAWQEEVTPA